MKDKTEFPVLYKLDNKGILREWNIWVTHYADRSEIFTRHGIYQGHLLEKKPTIVTSGKNLGKSNETTIREQSVNMAKSIFEKKKIKEQFKEYIVKDYCKDFRPMLAATFETKKKCKFPKYIQPKLDGVRCNAMIINKEVQLLSRTGKIIHNLEHIRHKILESKIPNGVILDGEIGCFGPNPKLSFQQSVGIIKRSEKKIDERELYIEYYIYDLYDKNNVNITFEQRWKILSQYFDNSGLHVKLCCEPNVRIVNNLDEVNAELESCLNQGFEGLMIRDPNAKYEQDKRSKALLKCKKFVDSEFEIIGFKEASGQDAGTIIFTCKTEQGRMFDVRPKGCAEERKSLFENAHRHIGKMLTVKYFEMTDDNVPRFPVGLTIRDYE